MQCLTLFLAGVPHPQVRENQGPPPARPQAAPRASEWKTDWRIRGDLRYNSNVWLLDSNGQDRLDANSSSDQASGRFQDMEAVDDVILAPDARFHAAGPSPLGRRLSFWADLDYPFYFQSSRRSHLEASVGAGHYAGPDGHLALSLNFIPQYFERNYLADAVDLDGNDSISSNERRYEHGDYGEWDLALEYRHRIADRTKSRPFGLDGLLTVGFREQSYDSPFRGHDASIPWVQLALRFEYGTGVKWGLRFKHEDISSPTEREVLILDEPDFGVDFNGNGTSTDQNARAFVSVDRTRVEREIGLTFGVDLSPSTEIDFFYTRTLRDYASDEPYDVGHRDREDTRDDFGVSLRYHPSAPLEWRLGFQWRDHDTDRPANPDITGDTFDYRRLILLSAVTYRW